MKKITEEKRDTSKSLIKDGKEYFRAGKFLDALECFEKVLSENEKNWKALNFKGCCLMKLNRFPEAQVCFDESLKIDDGKSESWGFLGTYYFQINENEYAKKCFLKAEGLEGNELSYSQLAYFYYQIEEYARADLYVERTLNLNDKNESALNTKGLLYIYNQDYPSAIDTFNSVIGTNHSNSVYYSNLGYAYLLNKNIVEAKKALDESISLDPSNAYALNNLAILYHSESDYLTAWNYIEQAISVNQQVPKFWENKAEILILLIKSGNVSFGSFQDVGYFLYRADLSTVDVIIALNNVEIELSKEERDQIFIGMINMDNFFTQTVNDCLVSQEDYLDIYKTSLEIVALLDASRAEEFRFAHYTTQDTANALIFQNSPFRLNSVTTANDPKEGYPLLNFLGFTGPYSPNIYQAFIGSFTFNPDSLNQFRLYGKNNNIEGSGVSLILSFQYFSDNANLNKGLTNPPTSNVEIKEMTKQPLFRCIYIDPLSRRVISLGHKEACVFYRENIGVEREVLDEKVNNYLKFINELTRKVEDSLITLNDKISTLYDKIKDNENQRNEIFKIIPMLLIHLRYLVKHYDFKEEQECRIIQVEPLIKNSNVKVTGDNNKMYIDYLPFHSDDQSYLTDVYWGPKTSNFDLFKDRVMYLGMNIRCARNEGSCTKVVEGIKNN